MSTVKGDVKKKMKNTTPTKLLAIQKENHKWQKDIEKGRQEERE